MKALLPCLTWAFDKLASLCKWGFLVLSIYILYIDGFNCTLEDWLLVIALMSALVVTICEIFAMIHIRVLNPYINYVRQLRNTDNE